MNNQAGSGFRVPQLSFLNKFIIIACGSLFLLQSIVKQFGGPPLVKYLGLSLNMLLSGHVYQIVTYPLLHQGFFTVLFNCLLLWFLGSELENKWGQKTYIQFILSALVGAAFVYILMAAIFFNDIMASVPLLGITGLCHALCLAYGIIFSDRYLTFMFIFPMKAKYFCGLIVGIQLYIGLFAPYGKVAWAHLAAMGAGYAFLKTKSYMIKSKREQGESGPKSGLRRPFRSNKGKSKANLYIVEDDAPSKDPDKWH